MLTLRKILFYIFLGIYLILCPLVILYSLGYIYAPKAEKIIVKTGLIHLETLPSGASVFLNDKLFSEKTSCTLSELLPKKYNVRVQLSGHRPWLRTVDVKAGKASVFDKILLLPKQLRSNILIPRSFKKLMRIPGSRFLLLLDDEKIGSVVVFDWKSGVFRRLVGEDSPYATKEIRRCFVAKGSAFVLFEVQSGGKRYYLWFGLHESDLKAKDLSSLFNQRAPDDVQWESGSPEYLFVFYRGGLSRFDLDEMETTPDFMKQLRGFGLYRGKVYGLKEDSLVRRNFSAGPEKEIVVESGRFFDNIFRGEDSFHLDFLSGDTIFFIGENGKLISNLPPYKFLKSGLVGYTPDATFKKVLVWTRQELGLFDFGKTKREEMFFERGPEIDWFFEKGNAIKQAYFVHDGAYALFCDGDNVRLFEIGQNVAKAQDIAKVRKDSVPFYSEKTGKLYFLEPQKGHLVSLEIIPGARPFERMFEKVEKEKAQPEQ